MSVNVNSALGTCHKISPSPSNILVCRDETEGGTKIKLADYGMASFIEDTYDGSE